MPAYTGLLKPNGSGLGVLKSTFNAENFMCRLYSIVKKIPQNHLFGDSRSFKIINVDKSYKRFQLRLTRRAKAYSSSCSQTVNLSPAVFAKNWPTTVKYWLLWGYSSLMPSCAGFLERRKSRLRLSKSTFNAKKFICSLSMSISIGFSAIPSWKLSRSPKSRKNP